MLIDSNLIQSTIPTPQAKGGKWADAIFNGYCSQVTISNSFVWGANGRYIGGEPMAGQFLPTQINVSKANPNFVNPHLLTAAPDCRTETSTVDCMAQLIADFTPQATGAIGLGYRKPGACAPNPDWPPWIGPGDVPDGIITKPCGM